MLIKKILVLVSLCVWQSYAMYNHLALAPTAIREMRLEIYEVFLSKVPGRFADAFVSSLASTWSKKERSSQKTSMENSIKHELGERMIELLCNAGFTLNEARNNSIVKWYTQLSPGLTL